MKKGTQRQLKLSLFGSTDDPLYDAAFDLIRTYERRLSPLVRCFMVSTSLPVNSEESLLQGGEWLTRHVDAVSVDGIVVTSLLSNDNAIQRIESYFNKDFLRQVFIKQVNIAAETLGISSIPSSLHKLTLQPLFNETLRVASYLLQIGETVGAFTVLIDPTVDIAHEFISAHDRLDIILLTHIPCDVVLGISLLMSQFPSVVVIHASNIPPSGTIPVHDCDLVINVSPSKGYLDSCVNYELAVRFPTTGQCTMSLPLAVFLSPTIGLDGLCRRDLYSSHRLLHVVPTEEEDATNVIGDTLTEFANRYHINEHIRRYNGVPNSAIDCDYGIVYEGVVLLASRGSYNLVNGQLESFWATFVGNLKRQPHTKALWKCFPSHGDGNPTNEELVRYIGERPFHNSPLPCSHKIFDINVMGLNASVNSCPNVTSKQERRHTIFLDLRSKEDFICGSRGIMDSVLSNTGHYWVSVPLDFSLSKYGARKAEIWLSCFIKPYCDLVIVPPSGMNQKIVKHRLAMVGVTSDQIKFIDPTVPRPPEPIFKLHRIFTHKELSVLDTPECLVVDIRSSEEFKNGSHHHSVHYPLGELLEDAQLGTSPGSSREETIINKLAKKAASIGRSTIFCSPNSPRVSSIALYCAGGYRTHIAASVLVGELHNNISSNNSSGVSVQSVYDVGGGAYQIMTQRPDMWHVKDRSIICIS